MTSTYINEALDAPRCDQVNITFTDGRTLPVGNWTVEDWIDVGYNEGIGEPKLEPIEEDREAYDLHWLHAQTASYKPGYTSGGYNSNWGTGKYNYMKGVFDAQTIDAMINANEIHPKTHRITPRLDIGEDAYQVKKLASTDNSFYNQQLGAFFPYNKESGFTGGRTGDDRFNQNPYKNTGNPYSGLSYPWQTPIPLDFNNFS